MLLTVSKHVAGTHLAALSLAEVPLVPDPGQPAKRARTEDGHNATHLRMIPATPIAPPAGAKRAHRSRHQGKGKGAAPSSIPIANQGVAATTPEAPHPSKSYVPSPFYDLAACWQRALSSASPVPRAATSALYFYPPPFLLDTVSTIAALPDDCPHPESARSDEKTHRYLHNLVRIR